MPTYVVVDKDKDPLDPGEIQAGGTIQVNEGDIFIFDSTANASTNFESANGLSTDFEIRFDESNNNNFEVEVKDELNADINIASNVGLSDIDIEATKAESVTLTAGNNVSLGKYDGSEDGADTLTIGDGFTTNEDIDTNGGNDSIAIGDNATIEKIETGDGDDTIAIGDNLTADDIKTGDGADDLTIGDGATVEKIETGDGDDTIAIGDNLTADDIKTGDGADDLTIGDGATVDDIDSGKGDDSISFGDNLVADDIKTGDGADDLTFGDGATVDDVKTGKGDDVVTIGDDFTGDKVETNDGFDYVTIGTSAVIDDLDGGKDFDVLATKTNLPNVSNFESIICFARGTLIRTARGEIPVEFLAASDWIVTANNGVQRIRWAGSSVVCGKAELAPIRIAKNALGNKRELWVSKQHRILVGDWRTELLFGEREVLAPANSLVDGAMIKSVEVDTIEYYHILFDRHEVVFSEGIPTESFHPGHVGLGALSEQSREEIFHIFPTLRSSPSSFGPSARHTLKAYEGRLLAA